MQTDPQTQTLGIHNVSLSCSNGDWSFLSGINSWTHAMGLLNASLEAMDVTLASFTETVAQAELQVSTYEQKAHEIVE